jgi:hypothetical protein
MHGRQPTDPLHAKVVELGVVCMLRELLPDDDHHATSSKHH